MRQFLVNVLLGVSTCVLMVSFSSLSWSQTPGLLPDQSQVVASVPNAGSRSGIAQSFEQTLALHLQEAESVLLAQDTPAATPVTPASPTTPATTPVTPTTLQSFTAVMTNGAVIGMTPETRAFGAAGAVLVGNRLVVRGDFSNLTSPLRDYATDPVSPPNPNITSGVHIHQGDATRNGPFQYALRVEPNPSGLAGRFAGEYTLTPEQVEALSRGELYLDLHTQQNRAGELRGVLRPAA